MSDDRDVHRRVAELCRQIQKDHGLMIVTIAVTWGTYTTAGHGKLDYMDQLNVMTRSKPNRVDR